MRRWKKDGTRGGSATERTKNRGGGETIVYSGNEADSISHAGNETEERDVCCLQPRSYVGKQL